MKVSVVVPTYNERGNIQKLLRSIHDALVRFQHEVIVVDDSSPDGTADAVRELADKNVRLVSRAGKEGIGSAYKLGLKEVEGKSSLQWMRISPMTQG